jgi:FMN phosphatase YigB (HAD superfamily)
MISIAAGVKSHNINAWLGGGISTKGNMKKFNPKLIMIDVDGTLVDSVPDLAYCVDELMVTMGREKWGEAQVRRSLVLSYNPNLLSRLDIAMNDLRYFWYINPRKLDRLCHNHLC